MRTLITTNGYTIMLDDEDYDRIAQYNWSFHRRVVKRFYGPTRDRESVPIAREIMRRYDTMFDHIDTNPLNNQKHNLREATSQQNSMNRSKAPGKSSKYKGVCKTRDGLWQVSIFVDRRMLYLGRFTDEIAAAKVYDEAAIKYYKDFAKLNFKYYA